MSKVKTFELSKVILFELVLFRKFRQPDLQRRLLPNNHKLECNGMKIKRTYEEFRCKSL